VGAICSAVTAALIAFSGPFVTLLWKLGVDPATFNVKLIPQTDPATGRQWMMAEDPISFQWVGPVALVVNIAVGTLISWVLSRNGSQPAESE
jgi:hypothetical protein